MTSRFNPLTAASLSDREEETLVVTKKPCITKHLIKNSFIETHHRGFQNMSEIVSTRIKGIKVSRLPLDFESKASSNQKPFHLKHQALHCANI